MTLIDTLELQSVQRCYQFRLAFVTQNGTNALFDVFAACATNGSPLHRQSVASKRRTSSNCQNCLHSLKVLPVNDILYFFLDITRHLLICNAIAKDGCLRMSWMAYNYQYWGLIWEMEPVLHTHTRLIDFFSMAMDLQRSYETIKMSYQQIYSLFISEIFRC